MVALFDFCVTLSPNWTFGFLTSFGFGGLDLGLDDVYDRVDSMIKDLR